MPSRKQFLRDTAVVAGGLLAVPRWAGALSDDAVLRLTILHTNDTHSRLDPFPMDGGRNQGLGGVAARAQLIEQIRAEADQVLLLDAGDIFQGTPYFNLYKGEPEIKALTTMGYDACTLGNHDFDAGLENLATQLVRHARFPVLVANYDFSGTPMEFRTKPWQVFHKGRLKVGVFGLGIEGRGLIPDNLFGATRYLDPIPVARETAEQLRRKEGCDLVICLSHLGHQYREARVSDEVLARETEHIDLIIGGHTHTFLEAPARFTNKVGGTVLVNQVGWGGLILGRIDFEFTKFSGKKMVKNFNLPVSPKTDV